MAQAPAPQMIKRYEKWELDYRANRYLEHATAEQLHERTFDLLNNLIRLSPNNGISPPPLGPEAEFWGSRFTHLLEESRLRGTGIYPPGQYAQELQGFCERIPDVESVIAGFPRSSKFLFKFAEQRFNQTALDRGVLRLGSASSFADSSLNRSRRDQERCREVFADPKHVRIRTESGHQIKPLGSVKFSSHFPTDYFVWCCSHRYNRRGFHDFKSDSCLVIHDVGRFLGRFRDALEANLPGYRLEKKPVSYYDPFFTSGDLDVPFCKPFRYQYQDEFRVVAIPDKSEDLLEPIFLELGSLEDCAALVVAGRIPSATSPAQVNCDGKA